MGDFDSGVRPHAQVGIVLDAEQRPTHRKIYNVSSQSSTHNAEMIAWCLKKLRGMKKLRERYESRESNGNY